MYNGSTTTIRQAPSADPRATTHARPTLAVPLLTPDEAAALVSVRRSWIYEAVRDGRLPCLRLGRHIRFTRELLEDWLAGRG